MDKFFEALDLLSTPKCLTNKTIEENIALIDSRCQYLKEINAERTKYEKLFNNKCNNSNDSTKKTDNNDSETHKKNLFLKNKTKNGLLMTCTSEKGKIIDCFIFNY